MAPTANTNPAAIPPATPCPAAPAVATTDAGAVVVTLSGPLQCQWSPCGVQPTEAVGLGGSTPEPEWSVSAVVAGTGVLVTAPSQCLV
jgi:hypothetical protein